MIDELGEGLRISDYYLENTLSNYFQQFHNLLSEIAQAGYLLAYDTARAECLGVARRAGLTQFAEGDEDRDRAQRVGDKLGIDLRFDVPPQEAIDYFKRKRALPPGEFYALEAEARSGAFAIANVYKTDVTSALQQEIIDALEAGRTQKEVIKRFQSILAGAGHKQLGAFHLETVFRTTTQLAYGVGRRRAQEEAADYLPIWEYSAVGDDRTRPSHMALDGLQYPVNHPFWDLHYPPWEWNCRCSVIPVLDYRKGYDRVRPNKDTSVEFDDDLPIRANVAGTPVRILKSEFTGVPRQARLGSVLEEGAKRALDSRSK